MAKIDDINKHYHTPAKRGIEIRYTKNAYSSSDKKIFIYGVLTSASRSGMYFNVRLQNGEKKTVHPYELDYFVAGVWVEGDQLKREYDTTWDKINESLNRSSTS